MDRAVAQIRPAVGLSKRVNLGESQLVVDHKISPTMGQEQSQLLQASADGDVRKVREVLVANKASNILNGTDESGWSALHFSASNGHFLVVRELLQNFAYVHSVDQNRMTPLHCASWNNHVDIIDLLVQVGADVDAITATGLAPIHLAASYNQYDAVERLLMHKAYIQAITKSGNTALHIASKYGYRNVCELLIARGADIDARNHDGNTPLHLAGKNQHEHIVCVLVHHGANKMARNKQNEIPVLETSWLESGKNMLAQGATVLVESANRSPKGPMDYAPLMDLDDLGLTLERNPPRAELFAIGD